MQSLQMFDYQSSFNNEILVLHSTPLIRKAVTNLKFETSYYSVNNFSVIELYNSCPFIVEYDSLNYQPIETDINLSFEKNNKINISIDANEVKLHRYVSESNKLLNKIEFQGTIPLDSTFNKSYAKFKIRLRDGFSYNELIGKNYAFQFHTLETITQRIQNKLTIGPENANVSVVRIGLEIKNYQKGMDFIEELTRLYLAKNLSRKNHMALNTITYINKQLEEVSDSLGVAESKLEDFRASNQMINISSKAGRVFELLQQAEFEKSQLERVFKYYEYLDEYFSQSKDLSDLVVPSSLGVDDQTLNQLIRDLIAVVNQRNELIRKKQEKSPYMRTLEVQIENLKKPIEENIRYSMSTMKRTLSDLDKEIYRLKSDVAKLPKTERQLVGIERKFQLNDAIYTYLLERRAEAQIARASNLPEHEIVEPARLSGKIFPNEKVNYVAASFFSLLFPSLIIWLIYFIDDRIRGEEDIEQYKDISFLGTVLNNHYKEENVALNNVNSSISESFRTLRTNLNFLLKDDHKKVVLLTSCIAGEGKSFVSLNLATSMALLGRKTVLVGFDLRKSNPYKKYISDKHVCLATYFVGESYIDNICTPTTIANLDIVAPNIIPPNPLELIGGHHTQELFNELRERYDCVIVDSPPIGIVSDSWLLMEHSDINLLVVREHYSRRHILDSVIKELKSKEIPGVGLLLNASKLEGKKYKYSYYNQKK